MTNAIVWKGPGKNQIWAVADSLVTTPVVGRPKHVLSVTDQAIKIMKLEVNTHCVLTRGEPFGLRLQVGVCFAGTVLPALMTHAAASNMLTNLHPKKPELPTMERIAELIRVISEKYIKAASEAYGTTPIPSCEFVVFGSDVSQKKPLEGGPLVAYRVLPAPNKPFHQVKSRVNLDAGKMAVIGSDHKALLADIRALQKVNALSTRGLEPRVALGNRMLKRMHNTVGGTLQFGILDKGNFELFGSIWDSKGNFQQNWLGFDCQSDMSDVLGIPVIIPALY